MAVAVEGPLAYALARRAGWPCRGPWHVALASAAATAMTHPQLWFGALWAYQRFSYWPTALVGETLVVLAEGLLISWMAQLPLRPAFLVSLLANAASCAIGLVVIG